MNWQDDPEVRRKIQQGRVRGRIVRSLVIWGPLFLASLGALVFFTFDRAVLGGDHGGTWFLVVVLAIFTLLFGFQAIQSFLDVRSEPRVATDFVTRRWSRNDSLVMRSHYVRLGAMILPGGSAQASALLGQEMVLQGKTPAPDFMNTSD